jgi:glyoxylase-like metal-dependent hydrolase (beta-lactamase superfamily II)
VYLLGGASHNSVAVEFREFAAVVEAPINEQRSLAVIEEVARLMPNKPIRFLVNTHQHFDHIGGLRTYLHIGSTIVTHVKNFDFYNRDVLNYTPRTVKPDMVSLWPPTELTEGYNIETVRENYVITDGSRIMQTYYVHPLQHVEGMLMAYLPKERIVVQATCRWPRRPRAEALSVKCVRSSWMCHRSCRFTASQLRGSRF